MRTTGLALCAVIALAICGCASTLQGDMEDVKFSGFLKDYSQLKPGGDDRAGYVYVAPGLSLAAYKRICIQPPQAYITAEQREEIGEEDLTYILSSLDAAFREELGENWEITDKPAADTLVLRMAISNAGDATGALTPFTRLIPWGRLLSRGVQVVSGEFINQGEVTGEMELTDAKGVRLAAAVDRRVGGNNPLNMFSDWGDVKDVFSYWGEKIAERLEEFGMVPTK